MPNPSIFSEQLDISWKEQVPIDIFLTTHLITGIVARLNQDTVELRLEGGKRCVIALGNIEAVSIA